MLGIAFLVSFFGYQVGAYGLSQVRGCNAGFVDILIPGKFKGCMPDAANSTVTPTQLKPTLPGQNNPNPNPNSSANPGVGINICIDNKTGKTKTVVGKCPKGYTQSATKGQSGLS